MTVIRPEAALMLAQLVLMVLFVTGSLRKSPFAGVALAAVLFTPGLLGAIALHRWGLAAVFLVWLVWPVVQMVDYRFSEGRKKLVEAARVDHGGVTVVLEDAGKQRVKVLRALRTFTGYGFKSAVTLVDNAPAPVLKQVNRETAEALKAALEARGATVSLK